MKQSNILFLILVLFFFTSCEEEFIPDVANEEPSIVVEGYVESGENALPPYVVLTKSLSFFEEVNLQALSDFYINDAIVTVNDGSNEVQLTEFCLATLTDAEKAFLSAVLGVDVDGLGINYCVYIDIAGEVDVYEGGTYELKVLSEDKEVSAVTTIPSFVGLDTLFFVDVPGDKNDTLAQMRVTLNDPLDQTNFYRYKTRVPQEQFFPGVTSVFDDPFINGQEFEFPLDRGQSSFSGFDIDTYGLFTRGDTIQLAWYSIDEAHFNFWQSLEFNRANQGPFSNYTVVNTNIVGGLGIWGGFSSEIKTAIVPPN